MFIKILTIDQLQIYSMIWLLWLLSSIDIESELMMSTLYSVSRLKILPADTKLKFPIRIKESCMGQNANTKDFNSTDTEIHRPNNCHIIIRGLYSLRSVKGVLL